MRKVLIFEVYKREWFNGKIYRH